MDRKTDKYANIQMHIIRR